MTYILHFILGFVASFLGTLPFGPINLSMVDTTLKGGLKVGLRFSVAAALVEIAQSLFAYSFGMLITRYLEHNIWIQLTVFVVLFAIGAVFFMRKEKEDASIEGGRQISPFARGAIVGLLNPQALPFWVAVIAALKSSHWLSFAVWDFILLFLLGVSLGKLVALLLYGKLSLWIVQRISSLSHWMNRIIGSIFILLALIQVAKMFG
ncbi:LysE family transporter [uncultured Microscilla sp.]|uniref:LysE family translocator n=1 Tax=uncultured Microscilla sp. TaxID=432653 RepID=UPI0026211B3E|nr:LysE family transporter [uncultured Microscilla sp.]